MSDTLCICGCTLAQHEFEHEESHYPESRTVETWRACKAHNCMLFRPVLPWPDAEGWWWYSDDSEPGKGDNALEYLVWFDGVVCWMTGCSLAFHPNDFVEPARFVRLLEPNPFTKGE